MLELGIVLGYSDRGFSVDIDTIREAESLGYTSVWTSEAYGSDAVSPAAWILAQTERIRVGTACVQMPARTPACAAMTAMTLQSLSGGRFILGIAPSGPQVVEGWHGVAYGKPLTRVREYVAIVRKIEAREAPVSHDGELYQLPYAGPDATGLGKPLKSILHATHRTPIYTGAITPGGLRTAAEVADGVFPLFMIPERTDIYREPLGEGFAAGGHGAWRDDFAIAPFVQIHLDDDLDRARLPVKHTLALYIGGMGAKRKNFYNDYAKRLGFAEAAEKIQDLYLAGHKREAVAAVPDALADAVALVGPASRIRERLPAWKTAASEGAVTALLVSGATTPAALQLLAEEIL